MDLLLDIKDAGILASFELWGWPYHGLSTSGVIDLAGSLTHTLPSAPAHGSAWLIDRGLDPIVRTSGQLAIDATLGHEWRNYGMISGGLVHGTPIGSNEYIHVDEAGERWLITVGTHSVGLTTNQLGLRFTIVQFGLFGEGVKTPIVVDKIVSCHDITYSMYGYTYNGNEVLLEDVWTNGSKAMVSYGLTASGGPVKDLFSVIEVTISGTGGADGSGLVISASEIIQDVDLSQSIITDTAYDSFKTGGDFGWTGTAPTWNPEWAVQGVYWNQGAGAPDGGIVAPTTDVLESYTYARFAYYNSEGVAKSARLRKEYKVKTTFVGASHGASGQLVRNNLDCAGASSPDYFFHDTAYLTEDTTCLHEFSFGVYLMEGDTIIDSLSLYQTTTVTEHYAMTALGYPPDASGWVICDEQVFPSGTWSGVGTGFYARSPSTSTVTDPVWQGSLSTVLGLPAPPDLRDGSWRDPVDVILATEAILAWRSLNNHMEAGDGVVSGSTTLGVQRIDAKAAAFYKPGTTRTYGTVMTPLGTKTAGMTPAGNLYFAWQRKTGDFAFSASPICYV